jgi:hypothetical protein
MRHRRRRPIHPRQSLRLTSRTPANINDTREQDSSPSLEGEVR